MSIAVFAGIILGGAVLRIYWEAFGRAFGRSSGYFFTLLVALTPVWLRPLYPWLGGEDIAKGTGFAGVAVLAWVLTEKLMGLLQQYRIVLTHVSGRAWWRHWKVGLVPRGPKRLKYRPDFR